MKKILLAISFVISIVAYSRDSTFNRSSAMEFDIKNLKLVINIADSSDPGKTQSRNELRASARLLYDSGNYVKAADAFYSYTKIYTDDPYGYYMVGMSSYGLDKNVKNDLVKTYIEKSIKIALSDSIKYKPILLASYKFFVMYFSDVDKNKSMEYTAKILELAPDDKDGLRFKRKFK